VEIDSFPQVNYTCRFLKRAVSSIFKKLANHWFRSLHLKRKCGASLNTRELSREKKVGITENLQPKHFANRWFSTSEIHVCRFLGRAVITIFKKLAKRLLGSLHLKRECGASLNARELMREKKVDMGKNVSLKHCLNR